MGTKSDCDNYLKSGVQYEFYIDGSSENVINQFSYTNLRLSGSYTCVVAFCRNFVLPCTVSYSFSVTAPALSTLSTPVIIGISVGGVLALIGIVLTVISRGGCWACCGSCGRKTLRTLSSAKAHDLETLTVIANPLAGDVNHEEEIEEGDDDEEGHADDDEHDDHLHGWLNFIGRGLLLTAKAILRAASHL